MSDDDENQAQNDVQEVIEQNTNMVKIPNINKFKGDNTSSFQDWRTQFEAQLNVYAIPDDKKNQVLLCCTEGAAFQTVSAYIAANPNANYTDTANHLRDKFTGEDYKRTLETKFRNMIFRKDNNVNVFANELRRTVKELYNITDQETLNSICINHVIGNLDESIKREVAILQLTGNKSLENLLELASCKMQGNFLKIENQTTGAASTHIRHTDVNTKKPHEKRDNDEFENRLDKLEQMFKRVI